MSKLEVKKMDMNKDALWISDVHVPFEDKKATRLVFEILEDHEFHTIILGGDILEYKEVMKHAKKPSKHMDFQDEIDAGIDFLCTIRTLAPNSKIIYLEGNHEDRLNRYLMSDAPALSSLRCLQTPKLLKLEELEIEFIPYQVHYKMGKLALNHGMHTGPRSGAAVKKMMDKTESSSMMGHIHRLGMVFKTTMGGTRVGIEAGCLFDFEQCDYMPDIKDWQNGVVSLRFFGSEGFFHANLHPVFRGEGKVMMPFKDKIYYVED